MSTIVNVNSASEFTRRREKNREEQNKVIYTDLVLYVKCANPKELATCSGITNIEEWALDIGEESSKKLSLIVVAENETQYTLVTFNENADSHRPDMIETPLSGSAFERLRAIGSCGYAYRRHRYDVPYTENTWYADVFKDRMGDDHPWVRLRLSVIDANVKVPRIPFAVSDFVYERDIKEGSEYDRIITRLWRNEWVPLDN